MARRGYLILVQACLACVADWKVCTDPAQLTDDRRNAFERLLRCHGTPGSEHESLYEVAVSMACSAARSMRIKDYEDFVSMPVLEFYRAIQRGPVNNPLGLLKCIILRRMKDDCRKTKGARFEPLDPNMAETKNPQPGSSGADATDPPSAARWNVQKRLHDALATLPPTLLIVVKLYYFEDLDAQTISERLSMSLTAVRVALHRARKRLRGDLGGESDDES